eukprot:353885-Amorphochlora_amoeboformis.AAC.1
MLPPLGTRRGRAVWHGLVNCGGERRRMILGHLFPTLGVDIFNSEANDVGLHEVEKSGIMIESIVVIPSQVVGDYIYASLSL